ncbi:MAG: RDD family protein [Candidatus Nanopelagicales bacterium]
MTDERRGPFSWLTNHTIDAVDVDNLLARVDIDAVVDRSDIQEVVDRVDPESVLDRIDPDRLLDRVDPDRLLDRVDPNRLLDRVDPNRLLDRVDPDRLMDRVDVDRLMARVDVEGLVDRAGVADIVAESTGAMAGSMLDVARRQLVAVDAIVERSVYRLTRRDPFTRPDGPPLLVRADEVREGRGQVTGTYAGPVSRVLAFLLDITLVFWLFTLATAAVTWVLSEALGTATWSSSDWTAWGTALFLLWAFLYWWVGLSLTGRTIGKAVLGLKVLSRDGSPLTGHAAALRTVVEPVSFLFLVGVAACLVTARRTTLHDAVARTCEVYDWGDRPAEMPAPLTAWIAKRESGR